MRPYSPVKVLRGEADIPATAHRNSAVYRAAERAGRLAETLTKFLYFLTEYISVAARQKTPFGELDLILRRRQIILILEVKYRRHQNKVESDIPSARQIARIRKTVSCMMARHYAFKDKQIHLRLVQWSGWGRLKQTEISF
jgi:putative endonuclease